MRYVCERSDPLIISISSLSVGDTTLSSAKGQWPGWVGDGPTSACRELQEHPSQEIQNFPEKWSSLHLGVQFCACGKKSLDVPQMVVWP